MMNILNIAGYKFTALSDLDLLRNQLLQEAHNLGVKGTILISTEGINVNLAGNNEAIRHFQHHFAQDTRFASIRFHEAYSATIPFKLLKVKIKKEIITMRQECVDAVTQCASHLPPLELKNWLDEKRDFTLLDTRNEFEIEMGAFKDAVHLHLKDFGEFAKHADKINRNKPIVMYCTGGIRCEKAALYLQNQGYENVYQLDGGILGYFAQVGSAHYRGGCFVFDDRVIVEPTHK